MTSFRLSTLLKSLLLLCGGWLLIGTPALPAFAEPIRVGVYDNKPLVHQAADGTFQGLAIDILRLIASRENWDLEFIPGTWTECLGRLDRGDIDLLVAIAVSDERRQRYSFTETTLITNWGRLYRRPGSDIESLLDLEGQKVALLEQDIHARVFVELMEKFNKEFQPVYLRDYASVLAQIQEGSVASGVVNRLYAMQNEHRYKVETTPLIFNPIEVRYAAPKDKHPELLAAIDLHLRALLVDKDSSYYQSLEKWFEQRPPQKLPSWIKNALLIIATLLLAVLILSLLLKRQINTKTEELSDVNLELEKRIAQLEQARSKLLESENRYRTVLDHQKDALLLRKVLPEKHATFSDVNLTAEQFYGYTRAEFLRLSPHHIVASEVLENHISSGDRDILLQKGELVFESTHVKKSGERVPVEVSASIIDLQGERYILSNVRDITERKQAEIALRESEERYQLLSDATFESIFMSEKGICTGQNKTAEKMFGYTTEEALGRPGTEWIVPADRELVMQRMLSGFEEPYEVTAQRKDGSTFPCEIQGRMMDIRGKSIRMTALRDITRRKAAESERLELEKQLHQKYKMEAVGLMAGGMAHNFNNNLSIVLGNIELLQLKMGKDGKDMDLLSNARTAVLRSRDLIRQIMTYSRQDVHDREPLEISSVVAETLKLLRSTIPTTVNLRYEPPAAGWHNTILADATRIQEALINLFTNAVHAMEEQGEISMSLERVELQQTDIPAQYACPPGLYIRLAVRDTGCGMSAETLEKIFDPFFTTKDVNQGTGMGLSSVQGIMNQHDGLIKVHSTPGQGTVFELYFPLIDTADEQSRAERNSDLPGGKERILFVDDEEMLADLGGIMLSDMGYQVTTATDSVAALERIKADPYGFDLVITDQTMPGLTGKELITEITTIRPELPVILCTGYSSKISEAEASQLGIAAFCMKPLEMPNLLQTIREVLDVKPG